MFDEMYYDTLTKEYTLVKDPTIPGSRYLPIIRGAPDIYIEHWNGKKDDVPGYILNVAYTSDKYNSEYRDWLVVDRCKEQHFTPSHLVYLTIPSEKFDEIEEKLI